MTKGDFPDDTFTETDVKTELDAAGLHYQDKGRYILAQCPTHDDKHPSVQIYKDDWFVNCHANCGRYHITKAFPSLRPTSNSSSSYQRQNGSNSYRGASSNRTTKGKGNMDRMSERKYEKFNLIDEWKDMPFIPRDHKFKGIPLDVLDSLGWRWDEAKNSYFIPYFSSSKDSIPFAQWRHLSGERRFTFLKDAKPTVYGTWNLFDSDKLFVVEGTSDAAVLDHCGIPWIALPSAASGELMKKMAAYCVEHDIQLIYAGDNDEAGDKLRDALDEVTSYRVKQPPKEYKDWGDFYEGAGILAVVEYCNEELISHMAYSNEMVANVAKIMGGGEEYVTQYGKAPQESKEQSGGAMQLF